MSKDKNNIPEEEQNQSVKNQVEDTIDEAIDEVEKAKEEEGDTPGGAEFTEEEKLKEDLGKEKDKFLRLFAEFENYKRRTSKERLDLFKTANQEVMTAMLPVLDDFERALKEMKKSGQKDLVKGVELIHNKLRETLNSKGLEAMKVKEGDTFDSELHEAITQVPAPKDKLKGKIVDVVETGYKLGERIIRYPKVVTGK